MALRIMQNKEENEELTFVMLKTDLAQIFSFISPIPLDGLNFT